MSHQKTIGILNSGGDCPGLNAVLHGVVGAATQNEWKVIGFRDGFEGLLPPGDYMPLDMKSTVGILKLGGTILGTVNEGNFAGKTADGKVSIIPPENIIKAKKTLQQENVSALIVVGGDGSLTTALQLLEAGIPVVGVPKTIDNDIQATAMTFGFYSAVHTVVDALERLHTTADSHKRVLVLEVMGRDAGWIALHSGIAGGADIILLPEIGFTFEAVANKVMERSAHGQHSTLIVVAEGVKQPGTDKPFYRETSETREHRLGGAGEAVAKEVQRLSGKPTRACVLGHLQRGGAPTALDRILGVRFGVKAVDLIKEGKFGHMVSYQSYVVNSVLIKKAVAQTKKVKADDEIVRAARAIGISFGDK
ncbi:MAG: 6-phosphofructokinase [Verrucomicrobiales bacterium]|nr:6-phosphofructokinase [Verrucomicrobiales bacterium]